MQNNEVQNGVQTPGAQAGQNKEYYVIDIKHIAKALWHKAWLILLVSIITSVIGFAYSSFQITPMYSSKVLLYVNNNSLSLGGTSVSISATELTAAQSLAQTYMVILDNRTTLEKVIEEADVDYTYEELSKMLSSTTVNDTEVLSVGVTSHDPYEAAKIANVIAEVLPTRIQEIIQGTSMAVVDSAVPNLNKVSPSISKYTAMGFMIGFVIVAAIVAVAAYMDDTIHDEDYLIENLSYPLLAVVPDLIEAKNASYGYRKSKYYTSSSTQNGN